MNPDKIALKEKMKSRDAITVYEDFVSRIFQFIENTLTRFHTVFVEQQDLKGEINKLRQEMESTHQKVNEVCRDADRMGQDYDKKITSVKDLVMESLNEYKVYQEEKQKEINQSIVKTQHLPLLVSELDERVNVIQNNLIPKASFLEDQITNAQERIHSLSILLKNDDHKKIQQSYLAELIYEEHRKLQEKIENKMRTCKQGLEDQWHQEQGEYKKKINQIEKTLLDEKSLLKRQFNDLCNKFANKFEIKEIDFRISKVNEDIKDVVQECAQVFANKTQTKKSLLLFERKIQKIELGYNIMNEKENQNIPPIHAKSSKSFSRTINTATSSTHKSSVMDFFGKRKLKA